MTVYVEYVFLDNFLIDLVLLILTAKIIKMQPKWYQYAIACAFGTLVSFVLPLFSLPVVFGIAIKLFTGILMCKICFWGQPFSVRFAGFVILLACLYSLGGLTIAFMFLLTKNPLETFKMSYSGMLPIGLVVFGAFCLIFAVMYLLKYIKERKIVAPFLRTIKLGLFGKTIELLGYFDSGNRLEDDVSGLPIVVVSRQSLSKKLSKNLLELTEKQKKTMSPHYIEATAATGKNKMLVFRPEFVSVANQKKNALIGISDQTFNDVVKIDALFGPALA